MLTKFKKRENLREETIFSSQTPKSDKQDIEAG
jgi:hypothetical protein